jgi:hypothetical protein
MPLRTKWIPFRLAEIRALPTNQSGVYEIGKSESDTVRYIGKSASCIRSRILTHKRETKFRGCTHFRTSKTHPEDARITEGRLLEAFKRKNGKYPPLNKIPSPKNELDNILRL